MFDRLIAEYDRRNQHGSNQEQLVGVAVEAEHVHPGAYSEGNDDGDHRVAHVILQAFCPIIRKVDHPVVGQIMRDDVEQDHGADNPVANIGSYYDDYRGAARLMAIVDNHSKQHGCHEHDRAIEGDQAGAKQQITDFLGPAFRIFAVHVGKIGLEDLAHAPGNRVAYHQAHHCYTNRIP